jgi:hypothetical protein
MQTFLNTVILLTVYVSINQHLHCSPVDKDRAGRGNDNDDDDEVQNQIQKLKDKILTGLGLDSVPTESIPRDEIPDALLNDILIDNEASDMAYGNKSRIEDEKEQEKKIMVLGKIGKHNSLFVCSFFFLAYKLP